MRVLKGMLFGALAGFVLGALARLAMRFAAVTMQQETHFSFLASGAIVAFFVLSGAGAGAAAAAGMRLLATVLLVGVSSALLLLTGGSIGIGEALAVYDLVLPPSRTNTVLVLAAVIGVLALATPFIGWRLGRSVRSVRSGA